MVYKAETVTINGKMFNSEPRLVTQFLVLSLVWNVVFGEYTLCKI